MVVYITQEIITIKFKVRIKKTSIMVSLLTTKQFFANGSNAPVNATIKISATSHMDRKS